VRRHRTVRCDGVYWFRDFPRPYWNTTAVPNGNYRLHIRVWDAAANLASATTRVTIRN
jgi:hypothetical protein